MTRGEAGTTGDPVAGSTDPQTTGNGSIMRLAPVALAWSRDPEQAAGATRRQSATTHGAPTAVEACAVLAATLVEAIATGDKRAALRPRVQAYVWAAAVAHNRVLFARLKPR